MERSAAVVPSLKMFSLFDKKALAYANPFYFHHKGEAIRAVEDLIRAGNSAPAHHPNDFALYLIGYWDEHTGVVTAASPIEFVEEVANCVTKKKEV